MFYDCLFSSSQGWAKTFYKMPWRVNFATKIWPPLATCDAKTTLTYYIHHPLHPHMVILSKKTSQLFHTVTHITYVLYQLNLAFLSLGWSTVSVHDLIQPPLAIILTSCLHAVIICHASSTFISFICLCGLWIDMHSLSM